MLSDKLKLVTETLREVVEFFKMVRFNVTGNLSSSSKILCFDCALNKV